MGKGDILVAAVMWGALGVVGTSLNLSGYTGFEVATLRIILSAVILSVALPVLWKNILYAAQKIPVRPTVQSQRGFGL